MRIVFLDVGQNLGYAGGNNVGIRYILTQHDCDYIWLLNNDTIVETSALSELVRRLEAKPGAGQCGSRLLYYDRPDRVQAYGGAVYNRWLGVATHLGVFRPANAPVQPIEIENRMSYVVGASMLVTRAFVQTVGLLSEDYFMFCEELDWITRCRKRFSLAYAHDSVVYHREGAVSGSSHLPDKRSTTAERFSVTSRLRFTVKFYSYALPTVWLGLLVAMVNRLRRGQPRRAWLIARLALTLSSYGIHRRFERGRHAPPKSTDQLS